MTCRPIRVLRRVMDGDLRRGLARADLVAKIDPHFDGGIARLGEGLRARHRADAHVDFEETHRMITSATGQLL